MLIHFPLKQVSMTRKIHNYRPRPTNGLARKRYNALTVTCQQNTIKVKQPALPSSAKWLDCVTSLDIAYKPICIGRISKSLQMINKLERAPLSHQALHNKTRAQHKKSVSMIRKFHTRTLLTNPRHHEEEPKHTYNGSNNKQWINHNITAASERRAAEATRAISSKIVSEYDQEIPQSQTADNPMLMRINGKSHNLYASSFCPNPSFLLKYILIVWGWNRKFRASRTPFVITRQASWCQTVIIGTEFSTLPLRFR